MSRTARQPRGISLIETVATIAILVGGVGAVGMTVSGASKVNRRNLLQSQALVLAERELERLVQLGCDGLVVADPCANLKAMDQATLPPVFWSANGKVEAGAGPGRTRFDLQVDVDPPFDDGETGAPRLSRALANGEAGQVVNVRVTVSWPEADRATQAMALQTRVAP